MADLTHLVQAAGASSLAYVDPAFPDRPLVLHAARPRKFDPATPVLFVHRGVRRNGRDYRDYWLDLDDEAEFPERSFLKHLWYHFGHLHAADGTPNQRSAWTFAIDERLFERLRAGGVTNRQRIIRPLRGRAIRAPHALFGFRDRVALAVSQCRRLLIDVPGVRHDGRGMSAAAAPVVSAALHGASE